MSTSPYGDHFLTNMFSHYSPLSYDYETQGTFMPHRNLVFSSSKILSATIEDIELEGCVDQSGHPYIVASSDAGEIIHYFSLFSLMQKIPALEKELFELAKIANFFFKGVEFQLIEDPVKFQKNYREQIAKEKESFDLPLTSLLSYGEFDVEEISSPLIREGCLVFYVKKKIPYRVTCEFPLTSEYPVVHYNTLNYSGHVIHSQ